MSVFFAGAMALGVHLNTIRPFNYDATSTIRRERNMIIVEDVAIKHLASHHNTNSAACNFIPKVCFGKEEKGALRKIIFCNHSNKIVVPLAIDERVPRLRHVATKVYFSNHIKCRGVTKVFDRDVKSNTDHSIFVASFISRIFRRYDIKICSQTHPPMFGGYPGQFASGVSIAFCDHQGTTAFVRRRFGEIGSSFRFFGSLFSPMGGAPGREQSSPTKRQPRNTKDEGPEGPICRVSSGVCGLPLGAKIALAVLMPGLATAIWIRSYWLFLDGRSNASKLVAAISLGGGLIGLAAFGVAWTG